MMTQDTLIEFINTHLRTAGWDPVSSEEIVSGSPENLIRNGLPNAETRTDSEEPAILTIGMKPDDKIAAVLQASARFSDPMIGQEYAFRSAQAIQKQQGGDLPLCFITDGRDLYYWESQLYPPVQVRGFPTKEDLLWMMWSGKARNDQQSQESLQRFVSNDKQEDAVGVILERMDADKGNSLVIMDGAEGRLSVGLAICSILLNSVRARRMLYIVNHPMFREQLLLTWSKNERGKSYWPDAPGDTLEADRMLYVTSSRALAMLIQAMNQAGSYISPFFFDGIIVDLIHPDITATDSEVFDYFKTRITGVTSQGPEDITAKTYKLFGCHANEPTFMYSRQDARSAEPPTLCEIEVLRSRPKFRIDGVIGPSLPPPVLQYFEQSGQSIQHPEFQETELERKVVNAPTNGVIVKEFMEESIKDAGGKLPGKTVVFALSKEHARRLQDLFDRFYPEYAGRLARVFDADHHWVRGAGGLLDRFIGEPFPRIAIVVDQTDWEIQVPEIANIVIARPVFDQAVFKRMIETGTSRISDGMDRDGIPWCPRKDRCLIFDCWGNFEFFQESPQIRNPGILHPAVGYFRAWLHLSRATLQSEKTEYRLAVIRHIRSEINSLVDEHTAIADEHSISTVNEDKFWDNLDENGLSFIEDAIAPLFSQRAVENPEEMKFRTDIMELKAALSSKNQDLVDSLKECIIAQVLDLPVTESEVLRERDLVDSVQYPTWWVSPSEQNLDSLADRLAPLMRYREQRPDPLNRFSVGDFTTVERRYEYGPTQERISGTEYLRRIRTRFEHLIPESDLLRKVLIGEKVAHTEVVRITEILASSEPYITDDVLEDLFDLRNPRLMHVVRYILDLELLESWSESVYHSVAEFMTTRTGMSVRKILFLHALRSFIIQKKALRRADLNELPFTRIHPEGIRGVFPSEEAQEIVAFAEALVIT